MKRLLLCTLILFSCSKKETTAPTPLTGFKVVVQQNAKLSTGEVVTKDASASVMIWHADGKDFDTTKVIDMISGYAYDKNAGASIKYDYNDLNGISKETAAGRYFVFVVLNDFGQVGRLAQSYTYFNVTAGNFAQVKKIFTTHITTGSFEDWNKPE